MSKMLRIGSILFIFVFNISSAYAQYAFDVKTQMAEKEDLQNYKQGLLTAIENSSWASVKETGEDYSLWLTSLERVHIKDSVIVSLIVELRTPSMFSSGDFVGNRKVWLKYNWEAGKEVSGDSFSKDSYNNENINYEESLNRISETVGLVSSVGMMDVSGLSSKSVGLLITELGALFKREPSPLEIMETIYLGKESLNVVQKIISETE